MKPLPQEIIDKLIENGKVDDPTELPPVVKLFMPDGPGTWLLVSMEPGYKDVAFGLCDLGHDTPELGSVSLRDLAAIRGSLGLPVERDLHFNPTMSLDGYADKAYELGRIQV